MDWFFYSVALPFGILAIGFAGAILFWTLKQNNLNQVAKPTHSFIEDDSVVETASTSSASSRR
ncbi:MAG: hypothetical protein SynsKO_27720 [Synoicihabitans sp.]